MRGRQLDLSQLEAICSHDIEHGGAVDLTGALQGFGGGTMMLLGLAVNRPLVKGARDITDSSGSLRFEGSLPQVKGCGVQIVISMRVCDRRLR